LGHVAQGGQGKYNGDCRQSLSPAFLPQKHRQWKYSLKDIMADCFFALKASYIRDLKVKTHEF
jgi:hypothetical protein